MNQPGKFAIAPFRVVGAWRRAASGIKRRHPALFYLWCVLSAPLYLVAVVAYTIGWFVFPLLLLSQIWLTGGRIPSDWLSLLLTAGIVLLWARVFLTQLKAATRQLDDRVLDLGTLWSLVMMFLAYGTALWFVGYNFGKFN